MAEEKTGPELVWSRERRAPGRQAMTLERIVAVSITITDAEGLDALSMRRVAADLDSGTTSLYRHVAGRDELLDLMIDAVQGEEPPPPPSGDWRADLLAVARRMRAALLRHPWLGAVMSTRPALGPNALRQIDGSLAAAGGLTSDITLASDVVVVLTQYVFGAVSRELSEQEVQRRTGQSEDEWRRSIAPYIGEVIGSGAYPQFARRVIEAQEHSFEELFEFGLGCLLDGIAGRVAG
ncbi:TetR/AcrR family transcriptional regulator C-terminal domain-containing protein [Kitasatospora nipponensis]|uniref:TetR/AcrR family transcriptional regulator C-terminal domain-containing protein n=1 Tax=Kitasatospora nipponensis TaxID=258049 RepID=A0ABN1WTT8_9ACTN